MPTVLRVDGFRVMIYPPDREHGPAHVHVFRGDEEVVTVRGAARMSRRNAWRAVQIVEAHVHMLRTHWRKYHGENADE